MAKAQTSPDDLLTTAEAGVELGITSTRVTMLIWDGRLKATRFGKSWMIRRADLDPVRDRPHGKHLTDWRDKKQGKSGENPSPTKPTTKKKKS
jgi:excisionase family DNA binding protein